MNSFWKLIEGNWARNLVNNISLPKERSVKNALDYDRLYKLCRMHEMLSSRGNGVTPLSHQVNFQTLIMEARSMPFKQQRAYVDGHVRAHLRLMARTMHHALGQVGRARAQSYTCAASPA